MLLELRVAGLGVIDDSTLVFGAGLTALTGETGAGKTLLVDALALVMGGRPKRGLVQTGRNALIEASFRDEHGDEVILAREIPMEGRARAWVDGRMASVSALAERSIGLCDIHGQHEHQSLLASGAFRVALDSFGSIDTVGLSAARRSLRALESERELLGGSPEEIERERALLEYQLDEITLARLKDPDEVAQLLEIAKLLEGAESLRQSLATSIRSLEGSETQSPRDIIANLRHTIDGFDSFDGLRQTLVSAESMFDELISDLRHVSDSVIEDPESLNETNQRLQLLHHLCRRYGPTLSDVMANAKEFQSQLEALEDAESSRANILEKTIAAREMVSVLSSRVKEQRQTSAPIMQAVLLEKLSTLALERAQLDIVVEGNAGDDVDLFFSANPGLGLAPVRSVASGGELARLMLAIRLALPGGPPTMVFDEVDAGIGGTAAVALASSLRDVASTRQVLVVTHLAQVAAVADRQISVMKEPGESSTLAVAVELDQDDRVREVARMLSGQPDSETARQHARELLGR